VGIKLNPGTINGVENVIHGRILDCEKTIEIVRDAGMLEFSVQIRDLDPAIFPVRYAKKASRLI